MNVTFTYKSNILLPTVQCGCTLFYAERQASEVGGEKLRIQMDNTKSF